MPPRVSLALAFVLLACSGGEQALSGPADAPAAGASGAGGAEGPGGQGGQGGQGGSDQAGSAGQAGDGGSAGDDDGGVPCEARVEMCNGRDDNCNGLIDEATDAECNEAGGSLRICQQGTCACRMECGGTCVDTDRDPENCGGCGHGCPGGCGQGICRAVSRISVGDAHACALLEGGGVRCWGSNQYGQLGDTAPDALTPRPVPGVDDAAEIAAGKGHTCARSAAGGLRCWGNNAHGQLGDGSTSLQQPPTQVPGLGPASKVAAGHWHTCALVDQGSARCWGLNVSAQIGNGSSLNVSSPTEVVGLTGASQLALAELHSCALAATKVLCWGSNLDGQIGTGDAVSLVPVLVPGVEAVQLSAGVNHTCALRLDGSVHCWGAIAAEPSLPQKAKQLASGGERACALLDDGSVWCWNDKDTTTGQPANQPHPIEGLDQIIQVGLGSEHGCALRDDGQVLCWGSGANGRLGNNSTSASDEPAPVVWAP